MEHIERISPLLFEQAPSFGRFLARHPRSEAVVYKLGTGTALVLSA
ncbi:MAG: hypothetical protein M3P53_06740 [Actinomycetota bacterium]|nr:hypothetical protein [Actinomycetota bacterium]